MSAELSRSEIADRYLSLLPYAPYPVQEEALLTWFTSEQGVLVCAPTGTGKTLIAQAALFEAISTGKTAYYTTPLIALTDQKFQEMQDAVERWGFPRTEVGLVTGHRKINPGAKILVVVAEILLNRLLHPDAFDFPSVGAVVVDEFHSFSDPERGIVWELTLSMLPKEVRLMLLSATVGNAIDFLDWLKKSHGRHLELVQDKNRKVPLTSTWVGNKFLGELLEEMAKGDETLRKTPALVFCFNREECWTVAEQFKGLDLLSSAERERLKKELEPFEWTTGVSPKLKQLLLRGVGVHHAGMLPKYRRLVEDLYLRKLLSVCVCTETLAAGINLPARSVVFSTLLKGPKGKKKIIDTSTAHQIAGRAGRPQFDKEGFVFALAHEDDVRILRWQEKYNSIPETTKDPNLLKVKKDLWRKRPTRRDTEQYWNEQQFQKLMSSPPAKLESRGPIPWRLLAYLLKTSPDVSRLQKFVRQRLMDSGQIKGGLKQLDRMLRTLHAGGFIKLEPPPPAAGEEVASAPTLVEKPRQKLFETRSTTQAPAEVPPEEVPAPLYSPDFAHAQPLLETMLVFRSVHPLYACFCLDRFGRANPAERMEILESLLELPRPILRAVAPPSREEVPAGPLEADLLDPELLKRGLIKAIVSNEEEEEEEEEWDEPAPPTLSDKMRLLFESTFPDVHDVRTQPIWAAGALLQSGNDFNKFVSNRNLAKQEGLVFRHLLRMILLSAEFAVVTPAELEPTLWRTELRTLAGKLTKLCSDVDPVSTEETMIKALESDLHEGESPSPISASAENQAFENHWDELLRELLPDAP